MIQRRVTTSSLTAIAVLLLVGLITFVTILAWNTINESELEQFRASQLQLVTALAQQTQAAFNNLGSDITRLSFRDEIQATSDTREEDALIVLEEKVETSGSVILSITRFDSDGMPRYAYPPEMNVLVDSLEESADYVYSLPNLLLDQTNRGQRAISEISPEFYITTRHDTGLNTVLLIAPVDARNQNTEFVAYELNLPLFFQNLLGGVDLGEEGQLWVLDGNNNLQYSARSQPTIDTMRDEYSDYSLAPISDPRIDTYDTDTDPEVQGENKRLAAIARAQSLNQNFILFLSREDTEPRQEIAGNLIILLAFSGVSMLSVVGLGSMFVWRISQESRARKAETERRQALRGLLQISHALNSSLDLSVVLRRILSELGRLIGHDSASILLIEDQELRTAAYEGASEDEKEVLHIDEARAAREVIARGYPIVINNTAVDDRWSPGKSSKPSKVQSWLGVPLRVREQLVGVLNINSHQTDHFTEEDSELAEAFADQASVALQNARLHELEVKQIEQELAIARGIQQSLLPDAPLQIPELELLANSLAAQQVSGDYHQYVVLPGEKVLIAIGDVQGKGIPAALMMAVIMTAMRDEALRHQHPAALLQSLNERLLDRMKRNHMNSALVLATYDPKRKQIDVANAGMVQPYIRRAGEAKFDFVPVGGYPLGVSESITYTSKTLDFPPGSVLVFFSDGVVEAQNKEGEFFGFERVEALLDSLPEDINVLDVIARILSEVEEHLSGLAPQDDTTILVMRALEVPETVAAAAPYDEFSTEPVATVQGSLSATYADALSKQDAVSDPQREPEAVARTAVSTEVYELEEPVQVSLGQSFTDPSGKPRRNVELFIPSKLGFEKIARGAVEAMASEIGFSDDQIEDIKTAVAEACMNAIEHGNEEDLNRAVSVLLSASEDSLEVRVMDTGKKALSDDLPEPGLGDMRGYGLFFMSHLVDEFEIKQLPEGGNVVFMASYVRSSDNGSDTRTSEDEE